MRAKRLYVFLVTTMNILNNRMDYSVAYLLNAEAANRILIAKSIKLREKMGVGQ
jgi:hypothetical protein